MQRGLLLAALACLGAVPAAAEPVFKPGQQIPMMGARICPTLESARHDANLAWRWGKEAYTEGVLDTKRNGECELVYVRVTTLKQEPSITPHVAWALKFDERGSETVEAPDITPSLRIKVAPARQRVAWYYSRFVTTTGHAFYGWVELPDEPYILKYLEHRKRAR
jgi:hypothetical protein